MEEITNRTVPIDTNNIVRNTLKCPRATEDESSIALGSIMGRLRNVVDILSSVGVVAQ